MIYTNHKASLSKDRCFLCGEKLQVKNRTQEHVFPKWIQKEFNLWDLQLTLQNGSTISYRNLTIPCCLNCNNSHLNRKLESKIRLAYNNGVVSFRELDETLIFLWLNKISYALLYKELYLRRNLRSHASRRIYTKKEMLKRKIQFSLVQAIKYPSRFIGKGWSIFIYELDSKHQPLFDYRDDMECSCVMLILNNIGIIANIADNGLIDDFDLEYNGIRRFKNEVLDPIQFYELYARVYAKSSTIIKNPFYTVAYSGRMNRSMTFIFHSMSGYVFGNWYRIIYINILAILLEKYGWTWEQLNNNGVGYLTFVENEDGSFKTYDKLIS